MEERLCALQGYELKGADRLSPYTKTNFPENFQEPKFTRKYDETGCPKTHLKYYMRKMACYADNVPFLIHTFQDSLEGITLTWFIALDIEELTSWEDLTNEFLQQYRFNTELAPTREELTRIEKKRNESFKAFAQRWRTMASQVKPVLNEREIKQLFLKTLPLNTSKGFFSTRVHLSKLLPMLLEKEDGRKGSTKGQSPRFAGFDMNKTCEYHMGERGHDVDDCNVLRYKVQQLLDKKILTFKEAQPNVQQNLLPNHAGGVNSISKETWASQQPLVVDASRLYNFLVLAGYYEGQDDVTPEEKLNRVCKMVAMGVMHGISKTPALYEEGVIAMITPIVIELPDEEPADDIKMEITEPMVIDLMVKEMSAIEVMGGNAMPVTIESPPWEKDGVIVLENPPKFDPKAVLWDYGTTEVDTVTRLGRCYAPDKGVEKKAVTEEEAKQFLAVVKSSEFNVVDQLQKLPAQISLLELFKSSEKHKDILLKVLHEVHVPESINEVQLEEFVGAVLLKDQISFTDEDLPPEGPNHTKALHISVKHESTLV
ncbi:uncharacterized protein LOC104443135 [Eucalyptus grandis]|uniref:uncharacterized protein LOC104443135 n=1 Tax=Eucalyptus grandis TaxID=71139 RepID=UPI00192EBF76|nr:uncharacterized protein LOC104443135 [Eucalyptus grandis]